MNKLSFFLPLIVVTTLLAGCEKGAEIRFAGADHFPEASAKPGLTLSPCQYEEDGVKYKADCGVLLVPENRQDPESRLIPLPVRRLHSTNPNKVEPVFYLSGGPGIGNISDWVPLWAIPNHDYIEVGYRGADGVTRMACPEVGSALVGTKRAFSEEAGLQISAAVGSCMTRMKSEGFDLNGYNIVEVVKDMEAAREALGYEQIILKSGSYGTRLALLYAHLFPHSIKRSVISGANPPGGMVWSTDIVDLKLTQFADLCRQDDYCSSRTDNLVESLSNAFSQVPSHWFGLPIDPDRVKVGLFNMLYQTKMAAAVFDAVIDAEEGDYSGFALLSMAYNFMFSDVLLWGDSALKASSADYGSSIEKTDFTPRNSIIGSPMMQLGMPFWRATRAAGVDRIPTKYRGALSSDVPTLIIGGDLDISTPIESVRAKVMPYLSNGTLVEIGHAGHQDRVPGELAMRNEFIRSGKIDKSQLKSRVMELFFSSVFAEDT